MHIMYHHELPWKSKWYVKRKLWHKYLYRVHKDFADLILSTYCKV